MNEAAWSAMNRQGSEEKECAKETNKEEKTMIEYERRTYKLTGITELLGSQPASDTIRTDYIATKAPDAEFADEESRMMQMDAKGLTVFLRDPDNINPETGTGNLIMLDYQVRAFFKGAFQAMGAQLNIKQVRHRVDQFLFIEPRVISITKNGVQVTDEDAIRERSLKAETMQGPRTALAASEMIKAPWEITFDVCLLDNPNTKTSAGISFEAIENALDYGMFQGLGQWRSGGNGRFKWERVDSPDVDHSAAIEKRRKAESMKKAEQDD